MHRSRFVLFLALVALISALAAVIALPPITQAISACTASPSRAPLLAQFSEQSCDALPLHNTNASDSIMQEHSLYLPLVLAPPPSQPPVDSSLAGRWVWVKDSDGTVPAPGAECTLFFITAGTVGTVDLNCIAPDSDFYDYGTFSVTGAVANGSAITLALPGVPISVAAAPYSRSGERLTLPFVLINDAQGTSEWVKQAPLPADSPDFVAVAFDAYEQAIAHGADDAAAAEAAAAALRSRSFPLQGPIAPIGAAEQTPAAAPLKNVTLNAQKTLLTAKDENGRVYYIWLKYTQPLRTPFRTQPPTAPLSDGFFANDPRTHLYMKPSSGPNDPLNHKAALLFPFHTQRVFQPRGFAPFSFSAEGEDPAVLNKQMLRAGYQDANITLALDGDVTPKVIMDTLLQNPGVFYISTHGVATKTAAGTGDHIIALGQKFEPKTGETFDQARSRTLADQGIPDYLWPGVVVVELRVDRFKYQEFLALTGDFFKALRANNPNWTMQRSLVYVDACESTANTSLPQHLRAAAFIGWRETSDPFVTVRYSQHFFRNLVRKTHSAREVWDETWRVLMTRQQFYEEDAGLDHAENDKRVKLIESNRIYDAYDADGKPYKHLGDQLYPDTRPDVVFWLVWLGRWSLNPNTASNNLQSCYDQYWSKGQAGGLASPLCNSGKLGSHLPTANEVKEARQLINGSPPSIRGGRWTLADKLAYADPFSGPMD
jgi:hypothetical protein